MLWYNKGDKAYMEVETTLAQEIRTKEGKEKYDAACKRLLSQKIILAWILKSCVSAS